MDFITWLKDNFPAFFANFVELADKFIDEQTDGVIIPSDPGTGPRDWLNDKGDGSYELTTSGISESQLKAIRQGIADGILTERAGAFLMGFFIAIKFAV